jgi:hypothetical protein
LEKRALVLALVLTLPLALYGVPYAYASVTTSDHVVHSTLTVQGDSVRNINVACPAGDYAVSGGFFPNSMGMSSSGSMNTVIALPEIIASFPTVGGAGGLTTGQTPDGWEFYGGNIQASTQVATADVWVVCETPVIVGGVSVPEFGSLYVAIALGAVAYFMLSRRFARRPTISAQLQE